MQTTEPVSRYVSRSVEYGLTSRLTQCRWFQRWSFGQSLKTLSLLNQSLGWYWQNYT